MFPFPKHEFRNLRVLINKKINIKQLDYCISHSLYLLIYIFFSPEKI